jgi:hypothetical protein
MGVPEHLLRPSLSGTGGRGRKLYSTTVGYIAAFFGGPLAAVVIALVNSHRLGRQSREWPLALGALLLSAVVVLPAPWGLLDWALLRLEESGLKLAWRVLGLGVFAASYLLHRKYHRSMEVMGVKAPSGWLLGITAIVLGQVPLVVSLSMRPS